MSNSPIAAREETKYFTPRSLHRIPVSEYDWERLKELADPGPAPRNWASFTRSLFLGVFASAVFNLIQLCVLQENQQYPAWVWVVAFVMLTGSGIAAAFSHILANTIQKADWQSRTAIHQELTRIEATFDPPLEQEGIPGDAKEGKRQPSVGLGVPVNRQPSQNEAGHSNSEQGERQSSSNARRRYPTALAVGTRVNHESFGLGVVRERQGDSVVVDFANSGRKRLLLGYAPLRVVVDEQATPREGV